MAQRAPTASVQASGQRPPTFSGFVVRLLAYLFLASLAFSIGELHLHMHPIQTGMATVVGWMANSFGASSMVSDTIISTPHAALEINHECTGVFVLLVYAMFVLAYPASWMQRLRGMAIGFVTLTAINVIRLAALKPLAKNPKGVGIDELFLQDPKSVGLAAKAPHQSWAWFTLFSALDTSAWTTSTISFGVLAGTNTPIHAPETTAA